MTTFKVNNIDTDGNLILKAAPYSLLVVPELDAALRHIVNYLEADECAHWQNCTEHERKNHIYNSVVMLQAALIGQADDDMPTPELKPTRRARDLLRAHHETYPAFWRWSQG